MWILANPFGWPEAWEPYLLQGVGDYLYPFHQHAPEIDEQGRLWVFDNGNDRSTPYQAPSIDAEYSRVVAYEIDEEAMTFEQVISFDQTSDGRLFSAALGDADWLPHIGAVLSVWGRIPPSTDWDKPLPTTHNTSARILLHKPDSQEPLMDLEFAGCRCDDEVFRQEHRGWKIYRAQWIPGLYPVGLGPTQLPITDEE